MAGSASYDARPGQPDRFSRPSQPPQPRWIDEVPAIEPIAPAMVSLGVQELHVWYCLTDDACDPRLRAAYLRLLAPEERARHDRRVFDEDRHEYLVTRALVRSVLSRYAPIAPADWRFAATRHGKPFVCGPPGAPLPAFNLSNTRGLVACVVAPGDAMVGIDVEDAALRDVSIDLAREVFSPFEVDALRRAPAAQRRERFLRTWTLKEAYIKARGLGLSIPLEQFWFHLDESPIAISFDAAIRDDARAWAFESLQASPRHWMALACRAGRGETTALRAARVVPLA